MQIKDKQNPQSYIKKYKHFYNALFSMYSRDVQMYNFYVLNRFVYNGKRFHVSIPDVKASTLNKSGRLYLFEDYDDESTLIGIADYSVQAIMENDQPKKWMYLKPFIVRSASTGRGIGTRFMDYVKQFAKKIGCNKIYLTCDNNLAIVNKADQQQLVNVAGYFYYVKNDFDLSVTLKAKDQYYKTTCLMYEYNLDNPTPKMLKQHFATLQQLEDFTIDHLKEVAHEMFNNPKNFKRYL